MSACWVIHTSRGRPYSHVHHPSRDTAEQYRSERAAQGEDELGAAHAATELGWRDGLCPACVLE